MLVLAFTCPVLWPPAAEIQDTGQSGQRGQWETLSERARPQSPALAWPPRRCPTHRGSWEFLRFGVPELEDLSLHQAWNRMPPSGELSQPLRMWRLCPFTALCMLSPSTCQKVSAEDQIMDAPKGPHPPSLLPAPSLPPYFSPSFFPFFPPSETHCRNSGCSCLRGIEPQPLAQNA